MSDTIGQSFPLVNTGEILLDEDSLDRLSALCYMLRDFPLQLMGSVSDVSLLQVPVRSTNRILVRSSCIIHIAKPCNLRDSVT